MARFELPNLPASAEGVMAAIPMQNPVEQTTDPHRPQANHVTSQAAKGQEVT
jgi:hypothetical protein